MDTWRPLVSALDLTLVKHFPSHLTHSALYWFFKVDCMFTSGETNKEGWSELDPNHVWSFHGFGLSLQAGSNSPETLISQEAGPTPCPHPTISRRQGEPWSTGSGWREGRCTDGLALTPELTHPLQDTDGLLQPGSCLRLLPAPPFQVLLAESSSEMPWFLPSASPSVQE